MTIDFTDNDLCFLNPLVNVCPTRAAHDRANGIQTMPRLDTDLSDKAVNPHPFEHGFGSLADDKWYHFTCRVVGFQCVRICQAKLLSHDGYVPSSFADKQIRICLAPHNDEEKWYTCYPGPGHFAKVQPDGARGAPDLIPEQDIRLLVDTGDLPPRGHREREQWNLARQTAAGGYYAPVGSPAASKGNGAVSQQQQQPAHWQATGPAVQQFPVALGNTRSLRTTQDGATGKTGAERNRAREAKGIRKRGRPAGTKDSKPRRSPPGQSHSAGGRGHF